MKEPTRWLDGGDGVPSGGRELLRHALAPTRMTAASRVRAAEQVAKLAAGAPIVPWAGWGTVTIVGLVVALGATAGIAAKASWGRSDHPANPPAMVPTRRAASSVPRVVTPSVVAIDPPVTVAASVPPSALVIATPPEPSIQQPGRSVRHVASLAALQHAIRSEAVPPVPSVHPDMPIAPESTISQPAARESESAWLARAHGSLSSDPERTLRELDRLASAYPNGTLVEEREFLALSALHRAGRDAEVRSRAANFLERHGNGLFASRVRALLIAQP